MVNSAETCTVTRLAKSSSPEIGGSTKTVISLPPLASIALTMLPALALLIVGLTLYMRKA